MLDGRRYEPQDVWIIRFTLVAHDNGAIPETPIQQYPATTGANPDPSPQPRPESAGHDLIFGAGGRAPKGDLVLQFETLPGLHDAHHVALADIELDLDAGISPMLADILRNGDRGPDSDAHGGSRDIPSA